MYDVIENYLNSSGKPVHVVIYKGLDNLWHYRCDGGYIGPKSWSSLYSATRRIKSLGWNYDLA